ncbi:hypothetical protein EUGRSUZ_I02293 [Eucalyptus grandis]|uniref:Uncharacterized protein n=2 Tax=Eucalyptus grandis TaxID=71139 RepID=A0ACC3JHY8_EUCGR|nr:hypothetical protein EUGRSUZ_I02293 [Eucalyptus grandis]
MNLHGLLSSEVGFEMRRFESEACWEPSCARPPFMGGPFSLQTLVRSTFLEFEERGVSHESSPRARHLMVAHLRSSRSKLWPPGRATRPVLPWSGLGPNHQT